MNNTDERGPAEQTANWAETREPDHCIAGYDPDEERQTRCTDMDNGGDCVHCECCCLCLGCEYGPRDGMLLTDQQRAPIAEFPAGG